MMKHRSSWWRDAHTWREGVIIGNLQLQAAEAVGRAQLQAQYWQNINPRLGRIAVHPGHGWHADGGVYHGIQIVAVANWHLQVKTRHEPKRILLSPKWRIPRRKRSLYILYLIIALPWVVSHFEVVSERGRGVLQIQPHIPPLV